MSTAIAQNQNGRIGSRSVRARRANGCRTERARPGILNRGLRLPGSPCQPPGIRRGAAAVASEAPVLHWADRQLLDACRRDFPICERPFEEIARRLDGRAGDVLRRLDELERCGVVNWIGPVPAPGSAGASTQVAMAVPKARLRSVREAVIRYPGINHMVEREHEFNLWFALAAPNAGELYDAVADIRRRTGVEVLDLRLERDYGGDLERSSRARTPPGLCRAATETPPPTRCPPPDESDGRLLAAVQEGLPLTARPYAAVAKRAGTSEARVIERLNCLVGEGLIARMGVVVRHDTPGFGANALVGGLRRVAPCRGPGRRTSRRGRVDRPVPAVHTTCPDLAVQPVLHPRRSGSGQIDLLGGRRVLRNGPLSAARRTVLPRPIQRHRAELTPLRGQSSWRPGRFRVARQSG